MLVVNLFGAPGAGKSTLALLVAGLCKVHLPEYSVECPNEIAKLKIYDESLKALSCQLYIAGLQHWQIARCSGHADIVVCDSPVLLSAVYATETKDGVPPGFEETCMFYHKRFESINYFVVRAAVFENKARIHTEDDETRLAGKISNLLNRHNIRYFSAKASVGEALRIVDDIKRVKDKWTT
jgi:nicotinamide riboside kinase